ncbi:glycosyltransferase family 4 protein [Corynebacterium uterequi]|uniref:Glycosyltransferase n=1 Tax=Corynebacterium uterequi TaxID=1072256 RepID=A0A0G3HHX7_9CORY|nr:glycosyltransferase family 1 protein [Corynebacterium uterequi]AKK10732.1 glycosyltransferase [Corynebacterium uterequi]
MRIALFTEVFLPKIDGVVTRVTRTLDQLAEMGHEVMIFAPGKTPKEYAGFEVIGVNGLRLRPIYPEITVGVPTRRVARALHRFQPDAVHSVNPVWLAGYGAHLAVKRNIPLIASFHTNVPEYTESLGIGWSSRPVAWWIRRLHNMASVNLCTSGPMVDKAKAVGIRNVELWPKAVDTDGYHPSNASAEMRAELSNGHPEDPLVSYVGRMSAEKNLHALLPIMERVRERIPNARLAMVGSGPGLEDLRQQFDPSWATFTGYKSGAALAAAFASVDVFAFPSTTETLGLVALESFASGVPVVGARAGGIPFVIDDAATGYLVDPHDYDAWADRLCVLLENTERRRQMGALARQEAERHGWRAATQTVVDFYQRAIDTDRPGTVN